MSLTQLRIFEAVASHGGFTAAARALGVSQPAVSSQLAALERAHGVRLIDRVTGAPTPHGAALHEITRPLFELADRAELHLMQSQDLGGQMLRIAADAPGYLMPLLTRMRRKHPDVRFVTTSGNGAAVVEAVVSGRADVGIAADVPDDPALHRTVLGVQMLVAVVRTDHPSASEQTLQVADLAGTSLIGREHGSVTRAALDRAAHEAGVSLSYTMTSDSRETLRAAVTAGLGIGVIGEDETLDDPRLVILDLREPTVCVTEYLICRAGYEESALWRALTAPQ